MRIMIEGEQQLIDDLAQELKSEDLIEVEENVSTSDLTEHKFGFAEAAAIVAIVKGTIDIVTALKRFLNKRRNKSGDMPLKLYVKTALGNVELDLKPDTTIEELQQKLAAVTAPIK